MNLLVLRFMTMQAEDIKRDDAADAASYRGGLSLDGDTINFTNMNAANKLAEASEIKGPDTTFEADQVSVCSCTGCSCFGNRAASIFSTFNEEPVGTNRRRRSMNWVAAHQIHARDKSRSTLWRLQQDWRRQSSSRSGSRLSSRLTFGIDSVWGHQDRPMRPPSSPREVDDVYNNFKGDYCFNGREKRASI